MSQFRMTLKRPPMLWSEISLYPDFCLYLPEAFCLSILFTISYSPSKWKSPLGFSVFP
jgi:hypothetical protein